MGKKAKNAGTKKRAGARPHTPPCFPRAVAALARLLAALTRPTAPPGPPPSKSNVPPGFLHEACRTGDERAARVAVARGAAVDAVEGEYAEQPIHIACKHGHFTLAYWLVAQGAAPDAKTVGGYAPIHYATFFRRFKIAQWLVTAHGISLATPSDDGATPLHSACDPEMFAWVLENDSDLLGARFLGKTPLQWAQQNGLQDVVGYLKASPYYARALAEAKAAEGADPAVIARERVAKAEAELKAAQAVFDKATAEAADEEEGRAPEEAKAKAGKKKRGKRK
jgi:ankyrin repeat protein